MAYLPSTALLRRRGEPGGPSRWLGQPPVTLPRAEGIRVCEGRRHRRTNGGEGGPTWVAFHRSLYSCGPVEDARRILNAAQLYPQIRVVKLVFHQVANAILLRSHSGDMTRVEAVLPLTACRLRRRLLSEAHELALRKVHLLSGQGRCRSLNGGCRMSGLNPEQTSSLGVCPKESKIIAVR
jgi:hypothetical protein